MDYTQSFLDHLILIVLWNQRKPKLKYEKRFENKLNLHLFILSLTSFECFDEAHKHSSALINPSSASKMSFAWTTSFEFQVSTFWVFNFQSRNSKNLLPKNQPMQKSPKYMVCFSFGSRYFRSNKYPGNNIWSIFWSSSKSVSSVS